MDSFELIKQGAEAKLYKGIYLGKPTIAKERFVKSYRHPILDDYLLKERIKAESRAIVRCKYNGIKTPTIYLVDFERRTIFMECVEPNITVKEYINSRDNLYMVKDVGINIGIIIGKMHQASIIHGDLTTSNMLLMNKNGVAEFKNLDDLQLVLIDFGLAHLDSSLEDKAVDLYVLERALLSTHEEAEVILKCILNGYQTSYGPGFKLVLDKFNEVRARGRKRSMVG